MQQKFCQSCGMPMTDDLYGIERDGSKSADYCHYCYQNGAFAQDCTMEEMIEACIQPMVEADCHMTPQQARTAMTQFFPTLRRWHK